MSIRDSRSTVEAQAVADAAGEFDHDSKSLRAPFAVAALALAPGGSDQYVGLDNGILMKLEGPEGEVREYFFFFFWLDWFFSIFCLFFPT